jgi:DNA repair protein RadC
LVRESSVNYSAISGKSDAARIALAILQDCDREHFLVIALDARNRPIATNIAHIGTLLEASISPREVFKFAILANAASIIVAHNHPSGNLEPSPEDILVTRRLVDTGDLLGVDVLDHIIVGDSDTCSLRTRAPSLFEVRKP